MFRKSFLTLAAVLLAATGSQFSHGLQQGQQPPTYVPQIAIPAMCALDLQPGAVTDVCYVIRAVQFGAELSDATKKPDSGREVLKVLLKAGGEKAVILSFPEEMGLDGRLALVEAEMAAMASVFDYITQRMEQDFENEAKANLLHTRFALLDSQHVEALRKQAFAQQASFMQAAKDYLTANPGTPGIQFQCALACNQLILAAQGVDVFDNPVATNGGPGTPQTGNGLTTEPTKTASTSPKSPSHHTGLIVGGVLAGTALLAGVAVAATAAAANCSAEQNQCSTLVNQCLNQHISSACSQINGVCAQSCRCQGFSGFNSGTGSCQ